MADQTMLQRLAAMLQRKPADTGITGATQALGGRPYQLHVAEAQAMGQQPMTPEQFAASQQPQMQPALMPAPDEPPKPFRF